MQFIVGFMLYLLIAITTGERSKPHLLKQTPTQYVNVSDCYGRSSIKSTRAIDSVCQVHRGDPSAATLIMLADNLKHYNLHENIFQMFH